MYIFVKTTSFVIIVIAVLLRPTTQLIEEEILKCPTISNGYHPYCECRYGPKYDESTNSCPNPECPAYNSTGLYPNCTCNHKNFDYSNYLNECFRVCPENSTGYWPKCNCDAEGYVFNKFLFECIACPLESTGLYPNCDCGKDMVYNNNSNLCEKCDGDSFGIFPNCSCSNHAIYDVYTRQCNVPHGCAKNNDKNEGNGSTEEQPDFNCMQCPLDSTGLYPNCICEQNGTYMEIENYCLQCPWQSVGIYPNCTCEENSTYINDLNSCYTCPDESIGQYPVCSCSHPFQYQKDPVRSSGIYPNCKCKNGYFSKYHISCIECPENSTGFYPLCKCHEEGKEFSAFINECYIACPENSIGQHPHCKCFVEQYCDVNEFMSKSNFWRECPFDSIGVGPDCLCMLEKHRFNSYSWDCITLAYGFSAVSTFCPDNDGKWPQCEASIERNTLLSLIG